ncbi:MAG: Holliday junction resolvase RuvX [Solirubrobacteraceae bacterium]
MRVLALDYGSSRCGVAISDPTGVLASPLEAVQAPDSRVGMAKLRAIIRGHEVGRVIVGLPLRLNGGDSEQTRAARAFAATLARRLAPTPVELYDERFTTVLAGRDGGGVGLRADEDSRAAAHLLEGWLERHGRV